MHSEEQGLIGSRYQSIEIQRMQEMLAAMHGPRTGTEKAKGT